MSELALQWRHGDTQSKRKGVINESSMDENQMNYDEFNKNRYLGSKRYLGVKDDLIIDLK